MKYAYTNAYLLDGTENMTPLSGYTVLTNEDRIEAIVPQEYDLSDYKVNIFMYKKWKIKMYNSHCYSSAFDSQKALFSFNLYDGPLMETI